MGIYKKTIEIYKKPWKYIKNHGKYIKRHENNKLWIKKITKMS
ncbi:MAG: hypothetical protein ACOX7X_02530 [Methanosarcina flavescens]|jgi:hypothetical protein